jgi:hypothetical protein
LRVAIQNPLPCFSTKALAARTALEAGVIWREETASKVVLVSKVKGGLLMLRSCDVDAEITCRALADIYKGG